MRDTGEYRKGRGRNPKEALRLEMSMPHKKIAMAPDKQIALVAHDNKKGDLVEWATFNRELLAHHRLYATGTTGELLEHELGVSIHKLQSGPLGGTSKSAPRSPTARSTFSSSSGIRSSPSPTIRTSRRSCA